MSKSRTARVERLADMLKALSHPNRLRLFLRLVECCSPGGSCRSGLGPCVGDVAAELEVCPSTISHHLKELRAAGVIRMERRGQAIECSVAAAALEELSDFFSGLVPGRGPAGKGKAREE